MEYTTMKRNGGWTIELSTPIGDLKQIDIAPVTLNHTIRWARHEIPSILALISELSGVKEKQLKELSGNDTDRLFIAFSFIASGAIKKDFEAGERPLATPLEQMSDEDRYAELDENDPEDPRFPKVKEPIRRFDEPPPQDDAVLDQPDSGMNTAPPDVLKKVS